MSNKNKSITNLADNISNISSEIKKENIIKNTHVKIAFYDSKPYDVEIFNEINQNYGYDINYFKYHLNPETAVLAKDHNIVCAFVNDDISRATIDELYNCGVKLIALRCAGYNNVDLKQSSTKDIKIVRVPGYSPEAVAEHAIALIMTLNRKIHKAYSRTKENNFSLNGLLGFNIYQKTVGVIGTGKIGQAFIKIMKGFGADVIAYDPYPNEELAKELGFKFVDLPSLYKTSDIISLHCPLTKETHHLINKNSLSQMKNNVMIINTSRGGIINTKDLIKSLKIKQVGSAGLDVYEEESNYFFEDFSNEVIADDTLARLLTFNNVIVTSHQGFLTKEALHNIANTTLESIKAFQTGKELVNAVI